MADEPITKSFTDWLWEREDALEKGSSSRNRIEFLKAKDDIQAALNEGWSGRMIWEQLRADGRIRFGHSAFAKYVRALIHGKPALGTPRSVSKSPPPANQATETPELRPRPTRFHHPKSPDMKDYL